MSEHKPPANDTEKFGDADSTPDWISELYRDAEQDIPPAEVDRQIMQLAAKKAEAPRNTPSRMHPRSKWVGALASAAVVVLSVSVFLSGEVTQQALQTTPARSQNVPDVAAGRQVQSPTSVRLEEVADVAVVDAAVASEESMRPLEPESVALMSKIMEQEPQRLNSLAGSSGQDKDVEMDKTDEFARKAVARIKPMPAESKRERVAPASEPQLRLASAPMAAADQEVQTSKLAADCGSAGEGLCTQEAGLFMLHSKCDQGYALPSNAQDIVPIESGVVFRLDATVVHAQCVEGLWQVDETVTQ